MSNYPCPSTTWAGLKHSNRTLPSNQIHYHFHKLNDPPKPTPSHNFSNYKCYNVKTLHLHLPKTPQSPHLNHLKSNNYSPNSNTYLTHPQPYHRLATPITTYIFDPTPPLSTSALNVIPIPRNLKSKNKLVTCCLPASSNLVASLFLHLYYLLKRRMAHGDAAWTTTLSTLSPSMIVSLCLQLTNF